MDHRKDLTCLIVTNTHKLLILFHQVCFAGILYHFKRIHQTIIVLKLSLGQQVNKMWSTTRNNQHV